MDKINPPLPMPARLSRGRLSPGALRWLWFSALALLAILTAALFAGTANARQRGWSTDSDTRPAHQPLISDSFQNVTLDQQGALWLTEGAGLSRLGPDGEWTYFRYPSGWDATALAIDAQGRAWVASHRGLALLATDGRWTTYTEMELGLGTNASLTAVAVDQQGQVWAGADSGLVRLSPNGSHWTYTTNNSGLSGNYVTTVLVDAQDRVWVGTPAGLSVRTPAGGWVTHPINSSGAANDWVHALAIDHQGRVWASTSAGLGMLSADGRWTSYAAVPGLSQKPWCAVAVDQQDRVWVGNGLGLSVLGPAGRWTNYTDSNSGVAQGLSGSHSLVIDARGRVRFASGPALITFDQTMAVSPQTVERLNSARLASLVLLALMVVTSGLWGLFRFVRPAAASAIPPGTAPKFKPGRLAVVSLVSSLVGPAVATGMGMLLVFVGMDGSGSLGRQMPWLLPVAVLVLPVTGLLLPVLAVVAGVMAFRQMRWNTQPAGRGMALAGTVLGGLFTATIVLPAIPGLVLVAASAFGQWIGLGG